MYYMSSMFYLQPYIIVSPFLGALYYETSGLKFSANMFLVLQQ